MINANELRIGNWVINPEGTNGVKEGRVTQVYMDGFTVDYHWPESWFKPIPLTPEVLEKCGFKYYRHNGVSSFDESRHDPEDFTHEWNIDVKSSGIVLSGFQFNLIKWGSDKEFTLSNNKLRIRVKHLHQLQNLYFSLTGQELNYHP